VARVAADLAIARHASRIELVLAQVARFESGGPRSSVDGANKLVLDAERSEALAESRAPLDGAF
jgi:hypothetical protein